MAGMKKRRGTATDELGGREEERRWNVKITPCVTRHRARAPHTPTFNANSGTTGKNTEVFKYGCTLIRIQLHRKLSLHQQHTKGSQFNQESHPEEFQPQLTHSALNKSI